MKTTHGRSTLTLALALMLGSLATPARADPKESPNASRRPLHLPELTGGDVDGSTIAGGALDDGGALGNALGVGDGAPGFSLTAASGRAVGLRELRGRWGLLVFVADRATLPALLPVAATLRSLGGALYSVSKDGSGALAALAARERLDFELLSDPTGQVSALYGMYDADNEAIRPGAALVNPSGRIAGLLAGRAFGSADLDAFARQSIPSP